MEFNEIYNVIILRNVSIFTMILLEGIEASFCKASFKSSLPLMLGSLCTPSAATKIVICKSKIYVWFRKKNKMKTQESQSVKSNSSSLPSVNSLKKDNELNFLEFVDNILLMHWIFVIKHESLTIQG